MKVFLQDSETTTEWLKYYNNVFHLEKMPALADIILHESVGDSNHTLIRRLVSSSKLSGKKLILIVTGDNPPLEAIEGQAHVLLFAPRTKEHSGIPMSNQIVIPTTASQMFEHNPIIKERNHLIWFRGTVWPGLRTDMKTQLSGRVGVEIHDLHGYWQTRGRLAVGRNEDSWVRTMGENFQQELDSVVFALCPKGNGSSSMRIWEAVISGAIPVLINDNTRIVFGRYNLDDFCLRFNTSVHTWNDIYEGIMNAQSRISDLQSAGQMFRNVLRHDYDTHPGTHPKTVREVAHGFSAEIVGAITEWIETGVVRGAPSARATEMA